MDNTLVNNIVSDIEKVASNIVSLRSLRFLLLLLTISFYLIAVIVLLCDFSEKPIILEKLHSGLAFAILATASSKLNDYLASIMKKKRVRK